MPNVAALIAIHKPQLLPAVNAALNPGPQILDLTQAKRARVRVWLSGRVAGAVRVAAVPNSVAVPILYKNNFNLHSFWQ